MMNLRTAFKAFVIGSSFFVVCWPLLYLSIAKNAHPESAFEFLFVPVTLPFIFGFINILVVYLSDKIMKNRSGERYLLFGALYGGCLALYGNFGKDIPVGLFGLPDTSVQYLVIPVAMLLYACVFRFVLKNLNSLFKLDL